MVFLFKFFKFSDKCYLESIQLLLVNKILNLKRLSQSENFSKNCLVEKCFQVAHFTQGKRISLYP